MDFLFVYPIPRYKTRMKLAGLELIQPPKCYMSLRTLQSICVRKIHMYGLGEDGEMTALATGDDRLLIIMLLIYFIFRGIRNKKLGEVNNFQIWVA